MGGRLEERREAQIHYTMATSYYLRDNERQLHLQLNRKREKKEFIGTTSMRYTPFAHPLVFLCILESMNV